MSGRLDPTNGLHRNAVAEVLTSAAKLVDELSLIDKLSSSYLEEAELWATEHAQINPNEDAVTRAIDAFNKRLDKQEG